MLHQTAEELGELLACNVPGLSAYERATESSPSIDGQPERKKKPPMSLSEGIYSRIGYSVASGSLL